MVKFVLVLILLTICFCGTKEEWRNRTIYQLLTDRFSRGNGDDSPCNDLSKYCGGTFKGIKDHLDYIQNLGFDAIWISPIPENLGNDYHGYAFLNLFNINPHFGGSQNLSELIEECHKRGIWVMLDIVANHVAPVNFDFSQVIPFNSSIYYHDYCVVDFSRMWDDNAMRENCRLNNILPDLNQNNDFVRRTLNDWIKNIVSTYHFDGLRVDTAPYVPKDFWYEYSSAAGVYTVGEIFDSSSEHCSWYQGPLSAALNYPMYFTLQDVFKWGHTMYDIRRKYNDIHSHFSDSSVLATFADNHDNPRFLNIVPDINKFKNYLVFVLFAEGIPIVYYGSEQGFNGGNDPYCREPLWTSMNPSSELYKFIALSNSYRKQYQVWNSAHVERYVDNNFYAFTRGNVLICITSSSQYQSYFITYMDFKEGQKLCNIFDSQDCIIVQKGSLHIIMNNGLPQVYALND